MGVQGTDEAWGHTPAGGVASSPALGPPQPAASDGRGRSQAVPLPLSLDDLETFMKVARTGLKKPLKEGDYDGLVEVMGHLMKVKERQAATDTMFEPLKQTIELLKTYGEEMPEETHVKLQVAGPGAGRRALSRGREGRRLGTRPRA